MNVSNLNYTGYSGAERYQAMPPTYAKDSDVKQTVSSEIHSVGHQSIGDASKGRNNEILKLIKELEKMLAALSALLQDATALKAIEEPKAIRPAYNTKAAQRLSVQNAAPKPDPLDAQPVKVDKYLRGSVATVGVKPTDFASDFYQGDQGNCGIISAIKAAMMKFGHTPYGIYQHVQKTEEGYNIVMRDNTKVSITYSELEQAAKSSDFRASEPNDVLTNAHFLYAVSAKLALLVKKPRLTGGTFAGALDFLNRASIPGAGFQLLGLESFMVPSKAKDFTEGTVGIISSFNHMYTVIDGMLDDYGSKVPLNKTPLFTDGVFGWQLGDKPKPRV